VDKIGLARANSQICGLKKIKEEEWFSSMSEEIG